MGPKISRNHEVPKMSSSGDRTGRILVPFNACSTLSFTRLIAAVRVCGKCVASVSMSISICARNGGSVSDSVRAVRRNNICRVGGSGWTPINDGRTRENLIMKSNGRAGGWGFIWVMAEIWMSINADASSRPLFALKQARITGKYVSSSAK